MTNSNDGPETSAWLDVDYQPSTATLEIRVGPSSTTGTEIQAIREVINHGFSARCLATYESLDIAADLHRLAQVGLSGDLIEMEILQGLLRAEGLNGFVAEDVVDRAADRATGPVRKITLSTAGGTDPAIPFLSAAVRARFPGAAFEVRDGETEAQPWFSGAQLALPTAMLIHVAMMISGLFRCESHRLPSDDVSDEVFALYVNSPRLTSKSYRYISTSQAVEAKLQTVVLLLGPRAPPRNDPAESKLRLRFVRPVDPRDFVPSSLRLARAWPQVLSIALRAYRAIHAPPRLPRLIRIAGRLLRADLHARWVVRQSLRAETTVIFGLENQADSGGLATALAHAGATTVHWLHGVVGDILAYRGHSNIAVVSTETCRQRIGELGTYDQVSVLEGADSSPDPPPRRAASGALLITNLLHVDSTLPVHLCARHTQSLLRMVRSVFHDADVWHWRPHPRELLNRAWFPAIQSEAKRLGFIVDCTTPLDEQVANSRWCVSTLSSALRAVVEGGRVPAFFVGFPPQDGTMWDRVAAELKFIDRDALSKIRRELEDEARHGSHLENLVVLMSARGPDIPPLNYFTQLAEQYRRSRSNVPSEA